ncbi:MAG: DUF4253 domain-containing protein [Lachnospiraceae bacterium]|nr:DUF4253 domain-containing protein [Lachnospiraceae bacterium]
MDNAKGSGLQQYNEITQQIIEKVKCTYQVFPEGESLEKVNEVYKKALTRGRQEGFVPVLVKSDDTLAEWFGILEDESYSREETIRQGGKISGEEILEERYAQYAGDYEEDFGNGSGDSSVIDELMGEMEDGEEINALTSFAKFSGDGIEETVLFEIPVKNPWEVIAWIPTGGWNECPEASEMMAVCRYWYEAYGAVPAAFSHDEVEFLLEKAVEDEETAWKLAKEHYGFCPDRVDQGTRNGTIGEVADSIRMSNVWYFWWD